MANNEELLLGDIIKSVNGKTMNELDELYLELTEFGVNTSIKDLKLVVLRAGKEENVTVKPFTKAIMDTQTTIQGDAVPIVKVAIGVSPSYKFSLVKSLAYSGERTIGSFTAVFDTLGLLFSKESVTIKSLSGPVGIFGMTASIASQGFPNLLNWMGLLSVNVGLLNLFPIPALDGGRLVFLGYEAITKKKASQKVETALISITMILLLGLMVYVTFNDILRLFK
jgi:regulator of sigma E protease